MEFDLQQLENILTKAKNTTNNEVDRLDIEHFLEHIKEIKVSETDKPKKKRILLSDLIGWIKTGKTIIDLIDLWNHLK
jgi:site-specific recombinase XerD